MFVSETKVNFVPNFIIWANISSRWITYLNIKARNVKILEGKMKEYL